MAKAAPQKATRIISKDEVPRFLDLGLGRGVDSTDPTPWANKSSFQVLPVGESAIIGTDEGGLLQTHVSRITSSEDAQVQLKASVSIPNIPVSLGVEGELSRSSSTSKKVKSQKALTRTISFRMDSLSITAKETAQDPKQEENAPFHSFEKIISTWIWKQICHSDTERKPSEMDKENPISLIRDYPQSPAKVELIEQACKDFVCSFGITHYVNSITLGASAHTTMATKKSESITKEGANISVPKIASVQQKLALKSVFSKSKSTTRYLGKIVNGNVERGTSHEAVIEVKILPIYSLIHENQLIYLGLHQAIVDYTQDKLDEMQRADRYIVQCGDEQMFWKVDTDYTLTIAKNFEQASLFYVVPSDESDEISIGWKGETMGDVIAEKTADKDATKTSTKITSTKIMRYLEVRTFFFSHSPGPLVFKSQLKSENLGFCLYNQVMEGYFDSPADDITPWTKKKKVFFVSSSNRKSFIAVERYRNANQPDPESEDAFLYRTRCVGSQKYHDEKEAWMLFRLLSTDQQDKKKSISQIAEEQLTQKLKAYRRSLQ